MVIFREHGRRATPPHYKEFPSGAYVRGNSDRSQKSNLSNILRGQNPACNFYGVTASPPEWKTHKGGRNLIKYRPSCQDIFSPISLGFSDKRIGVTPCLER
jgi:hypothetical protein